MHLSKREKQVLDILKRTQGNPPSYDELCEEIGLKSRSNIHRFILGLEKKGFITRIAGGSRAVRVIGAICPCCGQKT